MVVCPHLSPSCLSLNWQSRMSEGIFSGPSNIHLDHIPQTTFTKEHHFWYRNTFNPLHRVTKVTPGVKPRSPSLCSMDSWLTFARWALIGLHTTRCWFSCGSHSQHNIFHGINTSGLSVILAIGRRGLGEAHPPQGTSLFPLRKLFQDS